MEGGICGADSMDPEDFVRVGRWCRRGSCWVSMESMLLVVAIVVLVVVVRIQTERGRGISCP